MAQVVCGIPIGDDAVSDAKQLDLCAKQRVLLDVLKVPAVLDIPLFLILFVFARSNTSS